MIILTYSLALTINVAGQRSSTVTLAGVHSPVPVSGTDHGGQDALGRVGVQAPAPGLAHGGHWGGAQTLGGQLSVIWNIQAQRVPQLMVIQKIDWQDYHRDAMTPWILGTHAAACPILRWHTRSRPGSWFPGLGGRQGPHCQRSSPRLRPPSSWFWPEPGRGWRVPPLWNAACAVWAGCRVLTGSWGAQSRSQSQKPSPRGQSCQSCTGPPPRASVWDLQPRWNGTVLNNLAWFKMLFHQ